MTPARVLATVGVAVLVVAGCADDGGDQVVEGWTSYPTESVDAPDQSDGAADEPAVEPTGAVVSIVALDNSFRPETVEVAVGDQVVWENRGMNEHDVLHLDGGDWGVEVEDFQPGDTYSHVFSEPGEYRYYCSIHGSTEVGMVGTVVVTG